MLFIVNNVGYCYQTSSFVSVYMHLPSPLNLAIIEACETLEEVLHLFYLTHSFPVLVMTLITFNLLFEFCISSESGSTTEVINVKYIM